MEKNELLKRIAQQAKRDRRNRRDPRYLQAMGFLVAKGFLKTNQPIPRLPNKRICLVDAIWAGKNVEPRILEVLPAAVLRLPNHFDLDPAAHPELFAAIEKLKKQEQGESLWGVPYEKYKFWTHLSLPDKRIKAITEKKITKTFRLSPAFISMLRDRSKQLKCSETEVLERMNCAPTVGEPQPRVG